MKKKQQRWNADGGSIDFMQLVIGLFIVALASAGTFKAIQFGNDHMKKEMRYRQAISIARSYMDYWQGRVHIYLTTDDRTMNGTLNQIVEPMLLDNGDPNKVGDEVYCSVRYGRITPVTSPALGIVEETHRARLSHYILRVVVTWIEPDDPTGYINSVEFQGAMLPNS